MRQIFVKHKANKRLLFQYRRNSTRKQVAQLNKRTKDPNSHFLKREGKRQIHMWKSAQQGSKKGIGNQNLSDLINHLIPARIAIIKRGEGLGKSGEIVILVHAWSEWEIMWPPAKPYGESSKIRHRIGML